MEKFGTPKNLDDLNDQPEKREVLQILHSLNKKREASGSSRERAQIKKEMLEIANKNDLIREAIVLLKISPEEWRLSQAINAYVGAVFK